MRIKRFNEAASIKRQVTKVDYSIHHTISNENIEDISLEMIDAGFKIYIDKYFLNSEGKKTNQPTSDVSVPIYDIMFIKNKPDDYGKASRYDGSYYYDDIEILKIFTSTLNKMKMLDIEDSGYYISNERYNIRLFLKKIDLSPDEVGFDLQQFSDRFYRMLENFESKTYQRQKDASDMFDGRDKIGRFEIKSYTSGGDGYKISFDAYTDGIYIENYKKVEMWRKVDKFDNKDQYDESIKMINSYLDKYEKFISYEYGFDLEEPLVQTFKGGLFKKNFKKTYDRYELYYIIKLK